MIPALFVLLFASLTLQGCEGGRIVMGVAFYLLTAFFLMLCCFIFCSENESIHKAFHKCFPCLLCSLFPWGLLLVMLLGCVEGECFPWTDGPLICQHDLLGFPFQCVCPDGGWGDSCWTCPRNMQNLGHFLGKCTCDDSSVPLPGFDGSVDCNDDIFCRSECAACTEGSIQRPDGTSQCLCSVAANQTRIQSSGCACAIGYIHSMDGYCDPCPEGSTTKSPGSEQCDVGITLGMHSALAGFCALFCAVSPVIVTHRLHLGWSMVFDVAVSSIDIGSDLFWVLTDSFYDSATVAFGFLFLFGTSFVFTIAFYVRGLPHLLARWWCFGDVETALQFLTYRNSVQGILQFKFDQWLKETQLFKLFEWAEERLRTRKTYQVFDQIDGELCFLIANLAATLALALAIAGLSGLIALVFCIGWALTVAVKIALRSAIALIMTLFCIVNITAIILYSSTIIISLICLGMVLNMTRLLAAGPVSRWYGALWSEDQKLPADSPTSPSSHPLRSVAVEPEAVEQEPDTASSRSPDTASSRTPSLMSVPTPEVSVKEKESKVEHKKAERSQTAQTAIDFDEVVWNWMVFTELLGETLPMLCLNFANLLLLNSVGIQTMSFANVGSMLSSLLMLSRLGFRYLYHLWFGQKIGQVPIRRADRRAVASEVAQQVGASVIGGNS